VLLTAGANKEAEQHHGFMALIIAAQESNDKCVELLLTAGADTEAKTQEGSTALFIAAQNGHDKCVELLLNAGCDVNALDNDGDSALCMAVQNEHIDCVRTLVRCGADVLIQIQGKSLDDIADRTNMVDALKAALRLPAEKRRRCAHCTTTTSWAMYKCVSCKSTDPACKTTCYCDASVNAQNWHRHKVECNFEFVE
jgi:serine/threonine-protein phosphatase 6 regulatory ankyrin repeat subunit B